MRFHRIEHRQTSHRFRGRPGTVALAMPVRPAGRGWKIVKIDGASATWSRKRVSKRPRGAAGDTIGNAP